MILDCTEVEVAVPSKMNSDANSDTSSHYTHCKHFKSVCWCCPIIFVSQFFLGSTCDKEIVRHSKVLEKMQPGDFFLADKGC